MGLYQFTLSTFRIIPQYKNDTVNEKGTAVGFSNFDQGEANLKTIFQRLKVCM